MDTEDNLRTMLCWHTRYALGDLYFSNMQELKRYLTELANEFAGDEYKRLLRERIVSTCVVDDRSDDVVVVLHGQRIRGPKNFTDVYSFSVHNVFTHEVLYCGWNIYGKDALIETIRNTVPPEFQPSMLEDWKF